MADKPSKTSNTNPALQKIATLPTKKPDHPKSQSSGPSKKNQNSQRDAAKKTDQQSAATVRPSSSLNSHSTVRADANVDADTFQTDTANRSDLRRGSHDTESTQEVINTRFEQALNFLMEMHKDHQEEQHLRDRKLGQGVSTAFHKKVKALTDALVQSSEEEIRGSIEDLRTVKGYLAEAEEELAEIEAELKKAQHELYMTNDALFTSKEELDFINKKVIDEMKRAKGRKLKLEGEPVDNEEKRSELQGRFELAESDSTATREMKVVSKLRQALSTVAELKRMHQDTVDYVHRTREAHRGKVVEEAFNDNSGGDDSRGKKRRRTDFGGSSR